MMTDRNELEQQLRESKLQCRLDKEEFKRLLQLANQCKVAVQKEEENESFSHHEAHKFHNPTGRHMVNSTELPGHDNVHTMMLKVKHWVSDILPQPHENEEKARRRYDEPESLDDEKISMTRTMFKSIMAKALEEQKVLADETSMQVAKVAFYRRGKTGLPETGTP